MRFRGVMIDAVAMREFTNITTALSKLSKECVLRITKNKLYFIVSEESCGPQPPMIWCELEKDSFFSEYLMEGVDETYVDIYLGFTTINLARSLFSLKQTAKSVKIKLTRKQCACLTLEIELPSVNMLDTKHITHDIPVTVIPRKAWQDYIEPPIRNYHITIEMPSAKSIKATVDRMKNMSSEIILKANSRGQMILQIKSDLATVSSRFQNVTVDSFKGQEKDDSDDEGDEDFIVCRIDIKLFSNFLTANQSNYDRFLCSMIHHKLVMLHLDRGDALAMQCFIPSIVK